MAKAKFSFAATVKVGGVVAPLSITVHSHYRFFQAIAREGDCKYTMQRNMTVKGRKVWVVTFTSDLERAVWFASLKYVAKNGLSQNAFDAVIGMVNDETHPYNLRMV